MDTKSGWADVDGIVFDAVGTIIQPCPPVAEVYARAAARQGVELARPEVHSRFRKHFREDEERESTGSLTTDETFERNRWRRIVRRVLHEVPDPERAFQELWDHFESPASWRCCADAARALASLHADGIRLALASNFDGRLRGIAESLEELAYARGALVISSEVGFRKPHPKIYGEACTSLGLPPGRIVFVGDDLENDVLAPIRMGMKGILLDRDGRAAPSGVRVVPDLDALVQERATWISGGGSTASGLGKMRAEGR
jgi:putative hydrolase of the HAD superfamily